MANVESCNYINIIFMREQNPPPPLNTTLIAGHQLRANVQVAANMFNLIFLPRFGHQKSLDLGGKVAPLIEKVKVAQETTENAKLQLREAPEMSFF